MSDAEAELRELLSACRVWRNATEKRLRLISTREATDCMLFPDRALIKAIDRTEKANASS